MKMLQVLVFAFSLVAAGFMFGGRVAAADSSRTLEGELVVTTAPNHFRIVGQNGSYTAASSVVGLDGHTVRVDVSSNGTVTQITDVPVPINPVTHGWSTVRGELVVTDAGARRFTFAGDTQSYVAPSSIDIAPYSGRMVEIKLDDSGTVTELHLLPPAGTSYNALPLTGASAIQPPPATACDYRGEGYSAGFIVCQSGTQYRCDATGWQSLGTTCPGGAAGAKIVLRPCMVGGATVASGSGVCRDGETMRCDDGTWINTQVACR